MAISRVQYKSAGASSATVAATFDSATTSGNLVVACVSCFYGNNSGYVTSVTISDNKGNTANYASAVQRDGQIVNGGGGWCEIFYCPNITGGATHTVTATLTGSGLYGQITIIEYSGITTTTPLDVTSSTVGAGNVATFTSGSVATTFADDLIVGLVHYASNTFTVTPDNGSVVDYASAGVGDRHAVIERIVSSSNLYAVSGTLSGSLVAAITTLMATFKAGAGAPAVDPTADAKLIIRAA